MALKKNFMISTMLVTSFCSMPTVAWADGESGSVGLQEIVVTAQRKSESAQKAAVPIDVISQAALANAGVTSVNNLNTVAPALTVAQGGGSTTSFFLRGVGNYNNNGYSDSAVAFNLDGIYIAKPSAAGSFYDLQRVEVLKGPQGTLYGRNATGGAINVIPQHPVIGQNSLDLTLGYGNYNRIEAEAAANLAVGDNSALRVSGRIQRSDGYNADGTDDSNAKAVRVQFLTKPAPGVSLRLSADYTNIGGMGAGQAYNGSFQYTPGTPQTASSPADYSYVPVNLAARSGLLTTQARDYFSKLVIGGSFNNPAPLATPKLNDNIWGVHGELNIDTGIGQITSITAYRKAVLDDLYNGPSFSGSYDQQHDTQFSSEIRLNGKRIGIFDWLVGGFYMDEKLSGNAVYAQYVLSSIQDYRQDSRSTATFGRIVANLTPRLRLTAAGRYTWDRKRFDGTAISLLNICTNAPPPNGPGCFGGPSLPVGDTLASIAAAIPASQLPFGFPPAAGAANARPFGSAGNILFYSPTDVDQTQKNSKFTYRLGAEADIAADSLAYVSYETGYRSGGFSLSLGHESYLPETIRAWTVGLKNRFFNRRLQVNIELFDWRYSNQQISHFGLDSNGQTSFFADNAGASHIRGVDLDVQVKATDTLLLTGTVQYLDNKLTEFTYSTPAGGTNLPPVVGCPYTPGTNAQGAVYLVNCAGKPGLNSPKWSINGGFEQTFHLGDYDLALSAQGRYRSNAVDGFDYLVQQNTGANFSVDAAIRFGSAQGAWNVTLWGRNLTNTLIPVLTTYNSSVAGVLTTSYAPPRTYGVRFSGKF